MFFIVTSFNEMCLSAYFSGTLEVGIDMILRI
jgi:hypothetical protein